MNGLAAILPLFLAIAVLFAAAAFVGVWLEWHRPPR